MPDEPIIEGPDPVEQEGPTHLHKDYRNSWCGKDISHLPATHEIAKTDCQDCLKAVEEHKSKLNDEHDNHSAEIKSLAEAQNKIEQREEAINNRHGAITAELEQHHTAVASLEKEYNSLLAEKQAVASEKSVNSGKIHEHQTRQGAIKAEIASFEPKEEEAAE